MFVTKNALPRRTVLRGLGATLALPLLDAMVPAMSALARGPANPVRRLGVVYLPNGMAMEHWTPDAEGEAFEATPILQPLDAFRRQMLVVSGLKAFWTPAHAGASTTFLTGAAGVAGETAPRADISIDQIAAQQFAAAYAAGVAGAGDRRARQRRTVQRQSQLRLHQYDLLAQPDHAAADGE